MNYLDLDPNTAFELACKSIESNKRLIVCGSKEERPQLEENLDANELETSSIIATAETMDLEHWFELKYAQMEEGFEMDLSENEGSWPHGDYQKMDFALSTDIDTGKPVADLFGIEIDVGSSWHIPAHLKYGGWNECPEPSIHCSIWKYWQEKFGAHIVGMSGDIIEAFVLSPPQSKEEATELAWEQYLYCSDIVDQGVETIANLGATLLQHDKWYFWWD